MRMHSGMHSGMHANNPTVAHSLGVRAARFRVVNRDGRDDGGWHAGPSRREDAGWYDGQGAAEPGEPMFS